MHEVRVVDQTIRPATAEGDRYFGLESGTNGTGPAMRRLGVPAGLEWRRHDGKPATGLLLTPPSSSTWNNPWDGR